MSRALALVLVAIPCLCNAFIQLPEHARGGIAAQKMHLLNYQMEAKQNRFFAPLDHFDPINNRTFAVQYFVDDSQWNGTGPFFMIIGGEGPVSGVPRNYVSYLAAQYGAVIVAIEHRYYGQSVPFNSLAGPLTYLTTQQALADVAMLIDTIDQQYNNTKHKWFTFGNSYSGALSAWFRLKYPDHTLGSLSSSGVVNAILQFHQYDEQVSTAIGPTCANTLRAITSAFEQAITDGQGATVKALFGAPVNMTEGDFFYMLAGSAVTAVQYGLKASLCSALAGAGSHPSNDTLIQTFANFTNSFWGPSFGSGCYYDTNCLINNPSQWQPSSRAWRWQTCSELAYFMVAPSSGSLRSTKYVTLDYFRSQCNAIWPGVFPDTNKTNAYYGGADINGTNIFFSDFSDDPWQQASVKKSNNPDEPFSLVTCDGCGHCLDMSYPFPSFDPPALIAHRTKFEGYLAKWLGVSSTGTGSTAGTSGTGGAVNSTGSSTSKSAGTGSTAGTSGTGGACSSTGKSAGNVSSTGGKPAGTVTAVFALIIALVAALMA